jgi:hypothetical protein
MHTLTHAHSTQTHIFTNTHTHIHTFTYTYTQAHVVLVAYGAVPSSSEGGDGAGSNSSSSVGVLCLWDINRPNAPTDVLVCHGHPTCCLLSPGRAHIALAGTEDGAVVVWDLRETAQSRSQPGWGGLSPEALGREGLGPRAGLPGTPRSPTYTTEGGLPLARAEGGAAAGGQFSRVGMSNLTAPGATDHCAAVLRLVPLVRPQVRPQRSAASSSSSSSKGQAAGAEGKSGGGGGGGDGDGDGKDGDLDGEEKGDGGAEGGNGGTVKQGSTSGGRRGGTGAGWLAGLGGATSAGRLSFQLATTDETGLVVVWTVIELPRADMDGSEADVGLSVGGKVKLVRGGALRVVDNGRQDGGGGDGVVGEGRGGSSKTRVAR